MWQVKASGFWLVAGYGFWLAAGYALKLDASGSCLRLKQVKGHSGLELMFMQDVLKCFLGTQVGGRLFVCYSLWYFFAFVFFCPLLKLCWYLVLYLLSLSLKPAVSLFLSLFLSLYNLKQLFIA